MNTLKDQLETYLDFAKPYYIEKDPAHDFCHIEHIIKRLDTLSEGLDPAPHKLHFLACFHGLGKKLATEGRTFTRAFLKRLRDEW